MTLKTIDARKLRVGAPLTFARIYTGKFQQVWGRNSILVVTDGYAQPWNNLDKPPYTYYGKGEKRRRVVLRKA